MNNFKRIGDYVSLSQGLAINKQSEHLVSKTQSGKYIHKLLKIASMQSEIYDMFISNEVNQNTIAHQDDIIYTRTGQVGEVFRGFEGVIHNNSFKVTNDNCGLIDDYLFTVLKSDFFKKQAQKLASGSVQPDLSHSLFKDIMFPYFDLNEQTKISNIYLTISNKIDNNNKIISTLEDLSRTLYNYWFVQFEFPNKNGKPYKSSGGKMVWNEELKKEIPEGWEVRKVSDFIEVVTGKEDANFACADGIYNYYTCSSNIFKCNEYKFDNKAILIAGNGDFNVKHYNGKFNAYQRTYVLIIPEKYYYLTYISAMNSIDTFRKGSNGSIVKFITKGDVENIKMIIPPDIINLDILNNHLEIIDSLTYENEKLINMRDWLLPMLMNGQATIN